MKAESDSEETCRLLEQLRAGESTAFNRLFERYRAYLCRVVNLRLDHRLRPRVDASDVVQEAHLQAAQRINEYVDREPMPLRLWLRKTAQECLLKARKRHLQAGRRDAHREAPLPARSSLQLAQRLIAGTTTPGVRVDRADLARRIRHAVSQLPESEREAVLLLDIEGLSSREAAYVLDIDRSTVNRRHGQAIIHLEKILRDGGLTESQL